ncbi:MAG: glycosyltransferase family 4 protein [Acidimicrobiales bacterium]
MTPPHESLGANAFGDWSSTTGLAQASRRLAHALVRRGVALSCTTVTTGAPTDETLMPRDLVPLMGPPTWPIDLWMLNINEFANLGETALSSLDGSRHRIATWYWELPTVPKLLRVQFDRVDEIWVASSFVRRSFLRYTRRPIHIVPTVVPRFELSMNRHHVRARLGIPMDAVMFLFTFDFNSSVARKNPLGVIEAFAQAFPKGDEHSVLVIKGMNLGHTPTFETDLRQALQRVNGRFIPDFLSQQDLADLFHACDVYVSTHRSEGFGLGIAEAMALGKPVIATSYSGNCDFMNAVNSCPLGYRLRAVTARDHDHQEAVGDVYVEGAVWAEPYIGQAAQWMRLLAGSEAIRKRIGVEAARTMREGFSETAVGRIAEERLRASYDDLPNNRGLTTAAMASN